MKDEIKGFVFINCVGEIDLTKYWFYQEKEIISLITDTKRPIHHLNLRNSNIVIIDDGFNNIGCCPTEKEMEIYLIPISFLALSVMYGFTLS